MAKKIRISKESLLQRSILRRDYRQIRENINELTVNDWRCFMEIDCDLVYGVTPLMTAVLQKDLTVAELLLESGAEPNMCTHFVKEDKTSKPRKWTALHFAVMRRDKLMIKLLMKCGADPDIDDELEVTPVESALIFPDIFQLMIECGANIENYNYNQKKIPLIFRAINLRNENLVAFLAQRQTKCLQLDFKSPVECAMTYFPEAVPTLINRNHGLHFKYNRSGETTLHIAIGLRNELWVKMLLEKGLDPNAGDNYYNRPLHKAVYSKCRVKMFLLLMSFGANPHLKNDRGFKPLFYAIQQGNVEVTELLLNYGVKPTAESSELKTAICNHKYKTATLLLKKEKIDINSVKLDNLPVIWYLLEQLVADKESLVTDLLDFVDQLLECGADLTTTHHLWGTVLHYLIYAQICVPNARYMPLFEHLLKSNKCDINQVFIAEDTELKGEKIPKEAIAAYSTPLSFALVSHDCEFFAEKLIQFGANTDAVDWSKFFFASKKTKALKMLYLSGYKFPNGWMDEYVPSYMDYYETMDAEYELDSEVFARFKQWLTDRESVVWPLSDLCRLAVSKHFKVNQIPPHIRSMSMFTV